MQRKHFYYRPLYKAYLIWWHITWHLCVHYYLVWQSKCHGNLSKTDTTLRKKHSRYTCIALLCIVMRAFQATQVSQYTLPFSCNNVYCFEWKLNETASTDKPHFLGGSTGSQERIFYSVGNMNCCNTLFETNFLQQDINSTWRAEHLFYGTFFHDA